MDKYMVPAGKIAICLGVIIVLSIILPTSALWFLGGLALIIAGIRCCRCGRKK